MGVKHYPGWSRTLPLGKGIFDLYPSRGDVTLSNHAVINTALEGPIQVVRYGTLTLAAGMSMSVNNPCRGLCILCDNLVMGNNAYISMGTRAPGGSPRWAHQNIVLPPSVKISAKNGSLKEYLSWIRETGYAIFDPNIFASPPPGMPGVTADYLSWPGSGGPVMVSAAGIGWPTARYGGTSHEWGSTIHVAGPPGCAGTNAPGGGGGGANYVPSLNSGLMMGTVGTQGFTWGGGFGGAEGVMWVSGTPYPAYGGFSNGDPNPYANLPNENRPGGVLYVLIRGNLTVGAATYFYAHSAAASGAFAGHGGGRVFVAFGGALSGTPNVYVNGGNPGTGYCGAGGIGSGTITTFSDIGL